MTEEDRQRIRNFILFRVYATDKEAHDLFPFALIVAVIALAIYLYYQI